MITPSSFAKVVVLSVSLLGIACESRAGGFLGIGDNKPGVFGIGDGKPGALGVGDNRAGAFGVGENSDRRPECCRVRMSRRQRRNHERAHARNRSQPGQLRTGVAGVGDGRPGIAGIGDNKPGMLGIGDGKPGALGIGDGKAGALGVGERKGGY